jgi:hypothetical protein
MRERAVELAFEGLRWHDLRRWMVADQKKYREKTVIDFDRIFIRRSSKIQDGSKSSLVAG